MKGGLCVVGSGCCSLPGQRQDTRVGKQKQKLTHTSIPPQLPNHRNYHYTHDDNSRNNDWTVHQCNHKSNSKSKSKSKSKHKSKSKSKSCNHYRRHQG